MSSNLRDSDSSCEESEGEEESILFPRKKHVKPQESDSPEEEDQLLADSDSDEAPEDIGFGESRSAALQQVKRSLEQIRGAAHKEKEKRRQKDTLYKQQKIESLKNSRLPDNFLDDLDDGPSPPKRSKKATESKQKELPGAESKQTDLSDAPEDDSNSDEDGSDSILGLDDDFIPLEKSDLAIQAVPVQDYVRQKPKLAIDKALDFRNKALYGVKTPRHSVKDMSGQKAKRLAQYK